MKKDVLKLSKKESEILAYLVNGASYKTIANILKISPSTVDSHVSNIRLKTNVSSKEQLIAFLRKNDLVPELNEIYKNLQSDANAEKVKRIKICGWQIVAASVFLISVSVAILYFSRYSDIADAKCRDIEQYGNKYTLSRDDIIKNINNRLNHSEKVSILALVGQGGAGKTTIARRLLSASDYDFVYEINAESDVSIKDSFINLAYLLATEKDDKKELRYILSIENEKEKFREIKYFVQAYLKKIKSWLLVFDNVDDLNLLREFCPQKRMEWGNGDVIITTRNFNIHEVSYFENVNSIFIGELKEDEKLTLFKRIFGTEKFSDSEIRKFLQKIPNFPLDVTSAAYYIKNVGISLTDYEKLMNEMSSEFCSLNKKLMYQYNNYDKTRYGIITSAFKNIVQENVECRDILLLMCLLDCRNIPINLIKKVFQPSTVDTLIYQLKKNDFVSQDGNLLFISQSLQQIGRSYLLSHMDSDKQKNFMNVVLNAVTPYKSIKDAYGNGYAIIPHLLALVANLGKLEIDNIVDAKIKLLSTVGFMYRYNTDSAHEALHFFDQVILLDDAHKILTTKQKSELILAAAETAMKSNRNDAFSRYLNKYFAEVKFQKEYVRDFINAYILLGALEIRRGNFEKANNACRKAEDLLSEVREKAEYYLLLGRLQRTRAFNMLNACVNRIQDMEKVILIAQEAEKSLETGLKINNARKFPIIKELLRTKLILCDVYNVLKEYDASLSIAEEAKQLLRQLSKYDNAYFCDQGLIAMNEGHSYLRKNQPELAEKKLYKAYQIFHKAHIGDYLTRLMMQYTETLVRLGQLEKAYDCCQEVLNIKNPDKNKTNRLFINTAIYNVAVIRYKQGDATQSMEYFKQFFEKMKIFCHDYLPKKRYEVLLCENRFQIGDTKQCFGNSLRIFEEICVKGSEFISDYVQKNLEEAN